MEKIILLLSILASLIVLPYLKCTKYIKDRIILFFMTGFFASFIDSIVVFYGKIEYPLRVLPNIFKTHLLFDMWLLPLIVICHDCTTKKSSHLMIIFQALIYSALLTIIEWYAERETDLIKWIEWDWIDTLSYTALIILFFRFIIWIIRWIAD